MSGSAKEDSKGERAGAAREPLPAAAPGVPPRASSQQLFELDTPGASDPPALGLSARGSTPPANDVAPPPTAADVKPLAGKGVLSGDRQFDSQLIDEEFAALVNTSQLEAPILAAHATAAQATPERRYDTRPMTHVSVDQDFDSSLKLPRPNDAIESRRGRLAVRYNAACAAYKILAGFEVGSNERKELVELFCGYESRIRASVPASAAGDQPDADSLHRTIAASDIDDLERALSKIEDRLLALDDTMPEEDFRARVSKTKQPLKALLRYARVLASKRFNIGYRRDRFEYLASELLTTQGEDQRIQLLPRDKAAPVLHHLLAGLAQPAAPEERTAATAYLREALEQLAKLSGPKAFFDSAFFLDLHGYKISMRDQITCAEFLYLCAAIHVELHNRMLVWSRNGTPSWQTLRAQLQVQQSAAEDVFSSFRRPRSTPAVKASPRPAALKNALPAPVPPKRKRKRKAAVAPDASTGAGTWAKLAGLALVIVLTLTSVLHSVGLFSLSTHPTALSSAQLQELSPLLVRGVVSDRRRRLDGLVSRAAWQRLTKVERRALASDLAAKLKRMNIVNASVLAYKTPAIQIEFSTIVFVDEVTGKPAP